MVKIKTFVVSLKEGQERAFEDLDKKVETLGNIQVMDIMDNVVPARDRTAQNVYEDAYLKRVVIYEEGKPAIDPGWEPYRPNLDTDIMAFLNEINQPNLVNVALERLYEGGHDGCNQEIKTIRGLVSMTFAKFKTYSHRDKYLQEKWDGIDKTLKKYGLKLYNKKQKKSD